MQDLLNLDHKIEFSGTIVPHQNTLTEGEIKVVVNMERTMIIHKYLMSPKEPSNMNFGVRKSITQFGYITAYQNLRLGFIVLRFGRIKYLNQSVKYFLIVMCGDSQTMYLILNFRNMESRYLNGLQISGRELK